MKKWKFWGKEGLQELGIILAVALAIVLYVGFCGSEWMGNTLASRVECALSLYPWYVMLVGGLFLLLSVIGCFTVYLPAMLSVNCTRKAAFRGMMAMHLALMGVMLALAAVIWNVLGNGIAVSGRKLLLVAAGGLLTMDAVGGLFGCVVARFGRNWLGALAGALFGGGLGMGFYVGISGGFGKLVDHIAYGLEHQKLLFNGVPLGIGIGLFLLTAFCEARMIGKMEARL